MSESFIENYKAKHTHPLNKLTHSVGIPMIVVSLPLFFFDWRWALGLFIFGWILQFLGHAIEGNQPAFFKNPFYLLVGPWWLLRSVAASVGLLKASTSKYSVLFAFSMSSPINKDSNPISAAISRILQE